MVTLFKKKCRCYTCCLCLHYEVLHATNPKPNYSK